MAISIGQTTVMCHECNGYFKPLDIIPLCSDCRYELSGREI